MWQCTRELDTRMHLHIIHEDAVERDVGACQATRLHEAIIVDPRSLGMRIDQETLSDNSIDNRGLAGPLNILSDN
ncbi:uncharacterized protein RCC_07519 [Ramularia collo-cygni]|uniref:Uncharacterized protein n=1 Tax=Ramularia collo-cygni TaxID=112498 RepID=A0A2D3VFJ1_9PEZI|nr:uncharacterized protein RCC_07519 [Ramularia collo-cygni]CZT21654.1 uncharacterized protein RCC_07519 [Ramularia collo-cygni]